MSYTKPVMANAGPQVDAIHDEWLSMKGQINTSFGARTTEACGRHL